MTVPLITVDEVSKRFVKKLDLAAKIAQKIGSNIREEVVHAVDNVTLNIQDGEVVGLVGESGCGKSTLGRMVAGILEPSDGTIHYRGDDIKTLAPEAAKQAMLKVQMIFQDPFASLNPRMRVEGIVGEAPLVHGIVKREELDDYLNDILTRCGLDPSLSAALSASVFRWSAPAYRYCQSISGKTGGSSFATSQWPR